MPRFLRPILLLFSVLFLLCFTSCFAMVDSLDKYNKSLDLLSVDLTEAEATVYKDISYGSHRLENYDLYLSKNAEKQDHLIIFIHGGSWKSGDKKDLTEWCKYFTKLGYTTATINYTLLQGKDKPNLNSINDQIHSCVQNILDYCSAKGVDLTDMALYGFSAGACQAMLYAYKDPTSSPLPIRFVAQQSGPTSFAPELWNPEGGTHYTIRWQTGCDGSVKGWAKWVSMITGQEVTEEMVKNKEDTELWKSVSPVNYIDSSDVPMLYSYSYHDTVIPPASKEYLARALEEALIVCDSYFFPNSGHMLLCDNDIQKQYIDKFVFYCNTYFT